MVTVNRRCHAKRCAWRFGAAASPRATLNDFPKCCQANACRCCPSRAALCGRRVRTCCARVGSTRERSRLSAGRAEPTAAFIGISINASFLPGSADPQASIYKEVVVSERHLNLEQLRKQARELLRLLLMGDEKALLRWDAQFGKRPQRFVLAHAQLVLAREAGFASWPRLKAEVCRQ